MQLYKLTWIHREFQQFSKMFAVLLLLAFVDVGICKDSSQSISLVADSNIRYITRKAWGAEPPKGPLDVHEAPVKFIMVEFLGVFSMCPTQTVCALQLRNLQRLQIALGLYDISYNFMIARDGTVFEGRGYEHVGSYRASSTRNTLLIGILDTNSFGRPTSKETDFAKKYLIEYGVKNGKIDKDYKEY